jgi:hypothetical protein
MKETQKIKFDRPIIIIGCPRSGTTLLFTLLNSSPELNSLYEESRFLFRKFYLQEEKKSRFFYDDALNPDDMTDQDKAMLLRLFHEHSFQNRFIGQLVNKAVRKYSATRWIAPYLAKLNAMLKPRSYRFVEKTPRNCFKIELLNELFPDAYFIFIKRDGRANISSLIQGWKKRKKEAFDEIKRIPRLNRELNFKNFDGKLWRFTLPPGWSDHVDGNLEEACAYQWYKSNESALESLEKIPDSRKLTISYEDLVSNTADVIKEICDFTEIEYNSTLKKLVEKPPEVNYLDGKPKQDKWKQNAAAIESVRPIIEDTMKKLGYIFDE